MRRTLNRMIENKGFQVYCNVICAFHHGNLRTVINLYCEKSRKAFCGKAQFPLSFGRIARNSAETVPFHKISTPENSVKSRDFSQCECLECNKKMTQTTILLVVIKVMMVKKYNFVKVTNSQ